MLRSLALIAPVALGQGMFALAAPSPTGPPTGPSSVMSNTQPKTIDKTFERVHNGHTYTVTTHRKLMQAVEQIPSENVTLPGDPGGMSGGNMTDPGMGGGPGGGPGGVDQNPPGGQIAGFAPAGTEPEVLATSPGVTGDDFAPSEYYASYEIDDPETGAKVTVELTDSTREIYSNALPYFDTGEFPNSDGNPFTISEQNITLSLPLEPEFHGVPVFAHTAGITVSGFQMEPGTNERAYCDGDLVLTVESFQDLVALGIDFNNAHVQPHGEYHFHGVSDVMAGMEAEPDADIVHIGFAYDGYMVYYSRNGTFKSSWGLVDKRPESTNCVYNTPADADIPQTVNFPDNGEPDGTFLEDWQFNEGSGDLDECNGLEINGKYAYFLTDEYPYIPRCLKGISPIEQDIGALLPSSAPDIDMGATGMAPETGMMPTASLVPPVTDMGTEPEHEHLTGTEDHEHAPVSKQTPTTTPSRPSPPSPTDAKSMHPPPPSPPPPTSTPPTSTSTPPPPPPPTRSGAYEEEHEHDMVEEKPSIAPHSAPLAHENDAPDGSGGTEVGDSGERGARGPRRMRERHERKERRARGSNSGSETDSGGKPPKNAGEAAGKNGNYGEEHDEHEENPGERKPVEMKADEAMPPMPHTPATTGSSAGEHDNHEHGEEHEH